VRFVVPEAPSAATVCRFLARNGIHNFEVTDGNLGLVIEIDDHSLTPTEQQTVARNFSFYDLFVWVPDGMEDVKFWEKPGRLEDAFSELDLFFDPAAYDVVTTIGARGFILGGAFSYAGRKPLVPVRKYRDAYDSFRGRRSPTFVNWRGEEESLFLFDAGRSEVRERFSFPIRSLIRRHGLLGNTTPAW